jgi:hypothetical protein
MAMGKRLFAVTAGFLGTFCCASTPPAADGLQSVALSVAQKEGASELGCEAVTTEVLKHQTIEEGQTIDGSEVPHLGVYQIDVSGCGKRTTYVVSCDVQQKNCIAGTLQKNTEGEPQLADKLQRDAVRAAQLRGAADFGCLTATTDVLRHETIEEGQTTGQEEPPHRAVYSIVVSGCGKRTTYVVACDDRRKGSCVAGTVQGTAHE